MSTAVHQATEQVTPIVREDDTRQHIEDSDDLVSAIRNGKLVNVRWNDLSESEKRQAYRNLFLSTGLY